MQFKRRLVGRQVSLLSMVLCASCAPRGRYTWWTKNNPRFKYIVYKPNKNKLWNIKYIRIRRQKSMIICCDMWMICLELNWFFYDPCRISQLSEFMDVTFFGMSRLNNFLLIDTTDRSKNSSDHLRIFFETHPLFCHQHFFNMKDSVVFLGLKLLILIKLSVFKLIYNL